MDVWCDMYIIICRGPRKSGCIPFHNTIYHQCSLNYEMLFPALAYKYFSILNIGIWTSEKLKCNSMIFKKLFTYKENTWQQDTVSFTNQMNSMAPGWFGRGFNVVLMIDIFRSFYDNALGCHGSHRREVNIGWGACANVGSNLCRHMESLGHNE